MAALTSDDPKELLTQHLAALRSYAKRVIVDGDTLSYREELDRRARFKEYAAIGDSFHLTEKDLVSLMFKGLLSSGGPDCWCAECRSGDEIEE